MKILRLKYSVLLCLLSLATVLISACQPMVVETGGAGGGSAETGEEAAGSVTEIDAPEASDAEESTDAGAATMIELSGVKQVLALRAVDELAAELGVNVGAISVTAMDAVDWPDASLGCPEEGMAYASVLTSGYKIMLEANGEQHEYHSSDREDSNLVKCEPEK